LNPAIEIRKKYDEIENDILNEIISKQSDYDHYVKLAILLQKTCTHKDENGNWAWKQLSDDLLVCPYCGITE
jgi:hypothetical protein